MIRSLLDWLILKLTGGEEKPSTGKVEYLSILEKVAPLVEDHCIYLETSDGEFIANGSDVGGKAITSVCVAYVKEGVKPWETEVPAKHMLEKVSGVLESTPLLLLSRNPSYFVGYYVQITSA